MPTPKRTTRKKKSSTRRFRFHWWKALLVLVLTLGVVSTAAASGFVLGTIRSMPSINILDPQLKETSFVYDKDDQLVTQLYGEQNRVPVKYSDIPENTVNAIVSIEDERFWQHFGLDIRGIMRAAWSNVTQHSGLQGASTLTQQLARTAWGKQIGGVEERTLRRKIQEAVLAIQLERTYTKKEILTMYLNSVYFGYNAYGIDAAAQYFFGKSVSDLDLAESAMLAGLPQNPAGYSPFNNMDRAKTRQKAVLNAMVKNGYISQEEANTAYAEPLKLADPKPYGDYPAPHFVDYVLTQLLTTLTDKYKNEEGLATEAARKKAADLVYGGGLHIYTTLDMKMQKAAEDAVANNLDPVFPMEEGKEVPEAGAVFLDVATGEIRAMVGGRTHDKMLDFNSAWQAYRQPGSSFKPIVAYAPAFDMGYTAATVIDDAPIAYQIGSQSWTPMNYDYTFRGLTTLREAVRRSINVVAVRLLDQIGIDTGIKYAQKLGIDSLVLDGPRNDKNLSLALGGLTKGVTPLEMARAYGTFANGGIRTTPYAIRKVTDNEGNTIIDNHPQLDVELPEDVAYIMTDVLRSVVEDQPAGGWLENWGTGPRANDSEVLSQWQVAGKTGTTSDVKDIWFVGYTPKYVGAVWMGYYNPTTEDGKPRSIPNGQGGRWPAMIWRDTMTVAHEGLEPVPFNKPDDIITQNICIKSGLLPGSTCWPGYQRKEVFIKGTEPVETGDDFVGVNVMQVTDEQLQAHPEYLEQFPSLNWNKWVLYEPGCYGSYEGKFMYNRPPVDFDAIKQAVEVYPGWSYSLDRALQIVPLDAHTMVPTVSCKDLPELFQPPNPGLSTQPVEGDEADYYMSMDENEFRPVLLSVYQDQLVHLHITNTGAETQNFTLEDFNVNVNIRAGDTADVDFTPDRSGIFVFYDDMSGRRVKQGRLIVRRP